MENNLQQEVILEVQNLKKWFPIESKKLFSQKEYVKALDDVSLQVFKNETLGIVGESGCGKSTMGMCIVRLLDSTGGKIFFNNEDITKKSRKQMRPLRKDIQIIFQDPFASLNPRMTVGDIIGEPLNIQNTCTKEEMEKRVEEIMKIVGLDVNYNRRYPHEFSGGQRQRICIARALILQPKIIVCDEPVSALDVSIQAQIINLMRRLQREFGISYLFISHDLGVVKHICDRVAVMYLGKIVEIASKKDLYEKPMHPYTQALLSAIPVINAFEKRERIILKGDIPSPANPPSGCRFHTRCIRAQPICSKEVPELKEAGNSRLCACHFAGQ